MIVEEAKVDEKTLTTTTTTTPQVQEEQVAATEELVETTKPVAEHDALDSLDDLSESRESLANDVDDSVEKHGLDESYLVVTEDHH